MAEERQTAAISRSEFYYSLGAIWVYIVLIISNQLTEHATLANCFLFGGALFGSLLMGYGVRQSLEQKVGVSF
jgi:hypothetical protein